MKFSSKFSCNIFKYFHSLTYLFFYFCLFRSQQTDPNDHLAEFWLSVEHAHANQVQEAIAHVKQALNLRAEHAPSLHALVLLLSAQHQHLEALALLTFALDEYPDNLNLLYTKAHLELQAHGGEVK